MGGRKGRNAMSKKKKTQSKKHSTALSKPSSVKAPKPMEDVCGTPAEVPDTKAPASTLVPLSRWFFLGLLLFLFWGLLFILTDIYSSQPRGFGEWPLALLHILRDHLTRADVSTYTFSYGMGMSIFRALTSGFGGILDPLVSLLPEKIYPQVLNLLSALRLSLAGVAMTWFLSRLRISFLPKSSKKDSASAGSKRISSFLSYGAAGTLYSGIALLLCILLTLPVSDTFFLLPILLNTILVPKNATTSDLRISIRIVFLWAFFLCANAAWGLILLPVPLLLLLFIGIRVSSRHAGSRLLSFLLAIGIGAGILLPQYFQLPVFSGKQNDLPSFLQSLGSDTDLDHQDVTFKCDATDMLLQKVPAMYITTLPVEPSDPSSRSAPVFETHFEFLNEWIYSLWPSLPAQPFQDVGKVEGQLVSPNEMVFSTSTLFMDPMYCAITLPQRQNPVEVYLNDHLLTTISHNPGTVLLELGSFQVGQQVNVKVVSENPEEVFRGSCAFGYLNAINWNIYTGSATFGVFNMRTTTDGITAETVVYGDSVLLTNIPYEKGWTMYLDGKTVPIRAYKDAWICATVPSGNYILHLHYTAPGSVLGGVISGISFLILAAVSISFGKKKTSSDPSLPDEKKPS